MKTIFLVDDDGLMRAMLTRALDKEAVHVRSFGSPKDALAAINEEHPALLISDIQMPEMTGIELTRCVRKAEIPLPVVLMTGNPSTEFVREAEGLGVIRVFEKPFRNMGEFVELVRDVVYEAPVPTEIEGLRREFLVNLAHDLRTPLTAIKTAIDGLLADEALELPEAHRRLVAISQRNVNRIIRLVEDELSDLKAAMGSANDHSR